MNLVLMEEKVLDIMESQYEVTRSDAQGILMAQRELFNNLYTKRLSSEEIAHRIMEA